MANVPLHAKKVYVLLQDIDHSTAYSLVSFATDFSINFTPRGVAYAHVMGTDVVPGVEGHGYTARARVNLLLSTDMPHWLSALDNRSFGVEGALVDVEANFDTGVTNLMKEQEFHVVGHVNTLVAILEDNIVFEPGQTNLDIDAIRASVGYVWELNDASIVGLEPNGRMGEYVSTRLEVETGRWAGFSNSVAD